MSNIRMEQILRNICMHKEKQKLFKQPGLWSLVAQKYLTLGDCILAGNFFCAML